MCKVLDAREKRGAKYFRDLMRVLLEQGYPIEEILAMTEEEEDREKLYRQFGIV